VDVEPSKDGSYACTYTAPAAGFYRLHITSEGTPMAGSPFSVQVNILGIPLCSGLWLEALLNAQLCQPICHCTSTRVNESGKTSCAAEENRDR